MNPLGEGNKGPGPLLSQNVIILTKDFTPSKAQLDLLNRGLTFIPTLDIGKNLKTQLELDMQIYHRKVKLATFFKDAEKQEPTPFTLASNWTPPHDKLPPEVHSLIQEDNKEFKTLVKSYQEKHNLLQSEVKALRELRHTKHIVIKPADKGSAVVILGRDQYIKEVNRQLSDTKYYKKLEAPIYLETIPIVHGIIDTLKKNKFITGKQKQYLKGDTQPRERRFYILPKVHKEPEKWTVPFEIPPGRPIVSDCSSETYRTAEFVDYFLNPLSVKHSSYVKDTYHFIQIVKGLKLQSNCMLFSIDIDSLYTNIDTPAGLSAVRKIFEKYPDVKRPDEEILKLLEINLTKNDFEFNGEYYLQIKGTAMGKKFAPAYANIFMANWEEEALAKCPKKPLHYLRYLDDIWGIWTGTKVEFGHFIDILNTHDPSIKLKYVTDERSIDFLDTTVYKGPSFTLTHKLDIKVFFKKTDTHALLFKTSFHPRHTFKGLVKSQLLRFSRICTQEADYWEAVKILFKALRDRGYSRSFLRQSLKTFRSQKQRNQKEIIPIITKFSSISTILNNKMKINYKTIIENPRVLENHRVISAYKRNKNLRDLLVRAKLQPLQTTHKKHEGEFFHRLKYIRNQDDKTIFAIPQTFTPQTKNVVYVISCSVCGKQYIGETKNSIATRMGQHKYNIKNKRETHTLLVKHFILHGLQAVKIAGVQSNSIWTNDERKRKERQWIYLLKTKEPFGLNIK